MSDKPLISVIVPIYKVEKYLHRCIDSIRNQEYKNLEILLVDDGSPDNCGLICDKYAKKDKRIKVIHKKNGGLSDARNSALDVMNGEYVTFVDSDDYVTDMYIYNLYNALRDSDVRMAVSGFENVFEEHRNLQGETYKEILVYSAEECLMKMFYQEGMETTAWGKLYHRSLFEDIRYPLSKLYEDISVTYKLICKCEKIAFIENRDYFYFQRKDSIQYQEFTIQKLDAIYHMQEVYSFIEDKYPKLKDAVVCRYFSILSNILFQIKVGEYEKEKEYLWSEMKKIRYRVLFNEYARKKARLGAAFSYLGCDIMRSAYELTQWRAQWRK